MIQESLASRHHGTTSSGSPRRSYWKRRQGAWKEKSLRQSFWPSNRIFRGQQRTRNGGSLRSDRFKCGVHSTLSKPRQRTGMRLSILLRLQHFRLRPCWNHQRSVRRTKKDMALLTGQEQDFASRHAQVHLIEDEPPHAQERSPFG